jgi:DHA2 family multidrug resistance protein
VGILLLAFALGNLQVILEQVEQVDWLSDQRLRSLALLAVVGLPVFVWWELRRRNPALDLRVLLLGTPSNQRA